MEWIKQDFSVTCDPGKQDLDVIHGFLVRSYWARGIPKETVKKSIERSLCFAVRHHDKQVGFAHGLYEKFGFTSLNKPHLFMERHNPDVYAHGAEGRLER